VICARILAADAAFFHVRVRGKGEGGCQGTRGSAKPPSGVEYYAYCKDRREDKEGTQYFWLGPGLTQSLLYQELFAERRDSVTCFSWTERPSIT